MPHSHFENRLEASAILGNSALSPLLRTHPPKKNGVGSSPLDEAVSRKVQPYEKFPSTCVFCVATSRQAFASRRHPIITPTYSLIVRPFSKTRSHPNSTAACFSWM
jgi:hypothetical protein